MMINGRVEFMTTSCTMLPKKKSSHPDKGYVLLMRNPWNLNFGFPCHYESPGFDTE